MTDENLNKVYWIIAVLIIIVGIGSFIISPTYSKVKTQQTQIENNISYTAPTT